MYITCKKCSTNFVVSAQQIGENGRRVRCSKCKNIWYAKPFIAPKNNEEITPEIELLKPIEGGVHLPSVVMRSDPAKSSSEWLIFLILFLIFSFTIFYSKSINFDFIHKSVLNLSISDVKVNYVKNTDNIILHYRIKNDGDKLASMPNMHIKILDAGRRSLKSYDIIGGKANLEPHEDLKLKTKITDMPEGASFVDVSIGN